MLGATGRQDFFDRNVIECARGRRSGIRSNKTWRPACKELPGILPNAVEYLISLDYVRLRAYVRLDTTWLEVIKRK